MTTQEATADYLAEWVLTPSKVVEKGYETVAVVAVDGRTVTGLVPVARRADPGHVREVGRAEGVAAERLLRGRHDSRRAARDRERPGPGRGVRPAAIDAPDRRRAAALPPDRRPTPQVRDVRRGRRPEAGGIESTSTDVLNAASAADPEHDGVEIWCSKRTTNSGP